MQIITCYTLFDITHTNVLNRSKPVGDNIELWTVQRNSQANLDTLLQCISLRSTPEIKHYPHKLYRQAEETAFGFLIDQDPSDKFWYWKFDFTIQMNGAFNDTIDELGYLIKDCHEVPMLSCGTECISLPDFLDTTPELNNIYFMENV